MSLGKLAFLVGVAWWFFQGTRWIDPGVGDANVRGWVRHAWEQATTLGWRLAGVLLVWGCADFAWKRRQFLQQMRMSFEDMKREFRESDGDPHVKAKIKQRRLEVAKLHMVKEVPTATVMVTNPTHIAVALRYDRVQGTAPRVVAKGEGLLAKFLVKLARQHGVPVVERKPLARALFKTVRLNQEIPLGMYIVVAELIRYVDQLKGIGPPPGMQAPPVSPSVQPPEMKPA